MSNRKSAKSSGKINNNNDFKKNKKQFWSILMFALGVLIFFVTLIEGTALWRIFNKLIFGTLGITGFLIAPILIYISVVSALEKLEFNIVNKIWQSVILLILISSSVQLFGVGNIPGDGLIGKIVHLYNDGTALKGGGISSLFFAWPMMSFFGEFGAKIIVIILIFILTMVLTGATLIQFLRFLTKPVKTIEDKYIRKLGESNYKFGTKNKKSDICADLGSTPDTSYSSIPFSLGNKAKSFKEKENENDAKCNSNVKRNIIGFGSNDVIDNGDTFNNIDDLVERISKEPSTKAEKQEIIKSAESTIEDFVNTSNSISYKDSYKYPLISFLKNPVINQNIDVSQELKINAQLLVDTLKSFGVQTRVIDISRGPTVTRYELQPSAGVKISKITNLADDIALNLATAGVRIEAPIPNKPAVGIEVPNKNVDIVTLREIIESKEFNLSGSKLTVALGKDIAGNMAVADLGKMPHTLIAGSTGSGKSVCVNSIIVSLLYKSSPDEVKLLMIDPKVVELGIYNGIPHLLVPVVTDPRKAAGALNWAVTEMLNRYKMFADNGVRDIKGYNSCVKNNKDMKYMPQIVIIIDELADLMMAAPNEVEDAICRLAQMARAAGMHLVIATQRPSVDVITGVIKANIPSRIAFSVSSQIDSRTIIDGSGAEKLLGRGDMLFSPVGSSKPTRVQGCFVSDKEVENVVSFIKNKDKIDYDEEIMEEIEKQAVVEKNKNGADVANDGLDDEMIPEAIKCVIESGQASTSYLQRKLKLGYSRAARIIDELENRGIVGPYESGKRKVLLSKQQVDELNLWRNDT